jgi:hypothetical protein
VLGDLERRADAVGERCALRGRFAEHLEHEAPHRIRRVRAVREELGEGRDARRALVAPVGLDQPRERLARERAGSQRRLERAQQRMARLAGEGPVELRLEGVERGRAVALVVVAQMVREAGEAVDREQVPARVGRQQAQRDREVLAPRAGEERVGRAGR